MGLLGRCSSPDNLDILQRNFYHSSRKYEMNANNLQTVSMGGQKIHYTLGCQIFYWDQVVDEN